MVTLLKSIAKILLIGGFLFFFSLDSRSEELNNKWIYVGTDNKLIYLADPQGNKVPDFSSAGYRAGKVAIPWIPSKIVVAAASSGDDTARIQQAIDELSDDPVDRDGFRGAVELSVGAFRIGGTLKIRASGVVLRGAGRKLTVLEAAGEPRTVIDVSGEGAWRRKGANRKIIEDYVPVGATTMRLDSTLGLSVGDEVVVQRPTSAYWVSQIGMDQIPQRIKGITRQWRPGSGLVFDRRIMAIRDDQIEIDAPLTNGISKTDDGRVWSYGFSGRIEQIGIENFSITASQFVDRSDYETSRWKSVFLRFDAVRHAWMRNVDIIDFNNVVSVLRTSSQITITDFFSDNNRNPTRRGALPMGISIDGQQVLVTRCSMVGRYLVAWATQSWATGPNVVHRCSAQGTRLSAGGHQRWATGLLFDNIQISGVVTLNNRSNRGSGQGWSAANSVLWNNVADNYIIESPPTSRNWAFGVIGKVDGSTKNPAEIYAAGGRVRPDSLFEAQVHERDSR